MPRAPGTSPESSDSDSSDLYSASEGNGDHDSRSSSINGQIEQPDESLNLSSSSEEENEQDEEDEEQEEEVERSTVGDPSLGKYGPTSDTIISEARVLRTASVPESVPHPASQGQSPSRVWKDSRSTSAHSLADRDFKRKRSPSGASFAPPSPMDHKAEGSEPSDASGLVFSRQKRAKTSCEQYSSAQGKGAASVDGHGILPLDKSQLPAEIWHYIFTYVPPISLGRLLQVTRAFNLYLVPGAKLTAVSPSGPRGVLKPQSAEVIWSAASKLHCPTMPKPIRSHSVLDIWKLILGTTCQFCTKTSSATAGKSPKVPWEAGPGMDGVRIIWPFGIRCCGDCLSQRTEKEMALFLSSDLPSFLVPALPFVLLTPAWHVIPSAALQNMTPSTTVQMTKYYFKPDIESVKHRLEEVKSLGSAAMEEWIKGLDAEGKQRMAEAARWEQWEGKHGQAKVKSKICTAIAASSPTTTNSAVTVTMHDVPTNYSSSSQHHIAVSNEVTSDIHESDGNFHHPSMTSLSVSNANVPPSRMLVSPSMGGFGYPSQGSFHQPRAGRNINDVNEAKVARRIEIERRCSELQPPLPPSVLNQMESFQAAILIPTPLTNDAWGVLKPRLLAQRDVAERRENERIAQQRASQAKFEERRQQESHLKEAKEVLDREWDEAQAPIRERLGAHADEIIQENWAGGKSITKDTSPKFAADVLIQSRKRFYTDIAKEDDAARMTGEAVKQDTPSGPPTRKLILENMKWLFDTKIKPLSEQYRKELFLCNGCDNFKFYGFEGVVQHYAAKHTNTLSMGSIIVHWRAEWPEHPPFHPDPSTAKAAFYAVPTPVSGSGQAPGGALPQPSFVPNGYSQALGPASQMASQNLRAFPQFSPGPYNQAQYSDHYNQSPYGPFAPPAAQHQSYPGSSQAFQVVPQNYHHGSANNSNYQNGFHNAPTSYQGYPGPYQGAPSQMHGSPYPAPVYPLHGADPAGTRNYGNPVSGPYAQPVAPGPPFSQSFLTQPQHLGPGLANSHIVAPGQPTGIYQVQIEEMARIARDVWFGTSGVKDLPSSVRIYVVVQHVVTEFKARFTNEPSLAMFTDGLASHTVMKPIKSANGLACKACVNGGIASGAGLHSHTQSTLGERKLYSLPSLLSHFQSIHIERAKPTIIPQTGITTPRLDWKEDMIELPDESMIQNLVHASGMDDQKLRLIAQVFPAYFSSPLPSIGQVKSAGPVPVLKNEYAHEHAEEPAYVRLTSPNMTEQHAFQQQPKSRQHGSSIAADPVEYRTRDRPSSLERPSNDDEYDPHRPAYLGPEFHRLSKGPLIKNEDHSSLYAEDDYLRSQPRHGQGSSVEHRPRDSDVQSDSRYHTDLPRRAPSRLRSASPGHPIHAAYDGRPRSGAIKADIDVRRSDAHHLEQTFRGRDYSIPLAQKKTSQSPNHSQGVPNPQTVSAGSEDGEVGDAPGRGNNVARNPSPSVELSAAERFLNEFLPGKDTEEYKRKTSELNRRDQDYAKTKWSTEQEVDRRAAENGEGTPEARSWIDDIPEGRTRETSLETPIHTGPPAPRNGLEARPPSHEVALTDGSLGRDARFQPSSASRPRELSPELVDPRYLRSSAVYHRNHRQISDHPRRPRSRYERYEAQRHEGYRTRSRSPRRPTKLTTEDSYYRTQDSLGLPAYEPRYRNGSPPPLRTQASTDGALSYHRIQSQPQYRYVEDSRDYRSTYGDPIEYVPVRVASHDQQSHDRYVVGRPIERAAVDDYIPYEYDRYGDHLYEHNGQVYSRRPRVYREFSDPRESNQPGPRY